MKRSGFLLLFLIFSVCATAQHAGKIKRDAEAMCKATLASDFNTLVNYTYPTLVTAMGGKVKKITILTKGIDEMKSEGFSFFEASVGEPGPVVTLGNELYSEIPQKVVMQGKGVKIHTSSLLIAISKNKGETWYFIDAGGMNDAQFKQILPAAYGKIKLPEKTKPIVVQD